MYISNINKMQNYEAYKTKSKKVKNADRKSLDKTDVVSLSHTISPEKMKSYLDGSFLDDDKYDKQLDKLIDMLF